MGNPMSSFLPLVALLSAIAAAQQPQAACAGAPNPRYTPVVAAGYEVRLVASGLSKPRGIIFDKAGNLLVVQQGVGINSLTFNDKGGTCVTVANNKAIVTDRALNHGIELSEDGKTLYASSVDAAFSYAYDAAAKTTSAKKTLWTGMQNGGHSTRTLLLSRKVPNTLLASRGSNGNIDQLALQESSTHSSIKIFNIGNVASPMNYNTDGKLLAWGLRNSVGVAEEPLTGAIYTVENSLDDMNRDGKDVHQDNPGEELNFHGYLNGTDAGVQGKNYGYPQCFAAWKPEILPNNANIKVGTQFSMRQDNTINDAQCATRIAPRLTFQAHSAPLDIKFDSAGTQAFITFHGSWDRTEKTGFKLVAVAFKNGSPVEPATSTTAAKDIVSNPNTSRCPGSCFRPVGLAFDSKGRLFMSSDSSGEIYVITKTGGAGISAPAPASAPPAGSSPSKARAARGAMPSPDMLLKAFAALPVVMN